jgi:protein-export membrane protein SecD
MNRSLQIRGLISLVLVLASVFLLLPTFRALGVSKAEREAAKADPQRREALADLDAKAIRRGLDLQGGMYLVLEIDKGEMSDDQAADALQRVREIIGNRIDQFGVSEPVIQTVGTTRIIVQLPGLQDPERAKDLIGRTARLEFRLVRTADDYRSAVQKLDEALRSTASAPAATPVTPAAGDSTANPYGELPDVAQDATADQAVPGSQNPFSALLSMESDPQRNLVRLFCREEDVPALEAMLASAQERVLRGMEFQLHMDPVSLNDGTSGRELILVSKEIALTGDHLTAARSTSDPQRPGNWQVSFSLDRSGDRQFAKLTGENVGRLLAISLDGRIKSNPEIIQKIAGGQGVITGSFTNMEANDLALLLRAGALPADVTIAEERTVGPSLGADSIRQGLTAGLWGAVLVVLFILIYYRTSGVIAVIALIANLLIMLAVLAQFGLVLTLPGIAGIVLTIGMAVDANVLINERIREELRKAKTVRAAVQTGYENATRTILDANITTLITGLVLLNFGTGPIKGFAVTLCIGILTSIFAALIVSRVLMDLYTRNKGNVTIGI